MLIITNATVGEPSFGLTRPEYHGVTDNQRETIHSLCFADASEWGYRKPKPP